MSLRATHRVTALPGSFVIGVLGFCLAVAVWRPQGRTEGAEGSEGPGVVPPAGQGPPAPSGVKHHPSSPPLEEHFSLFPQTVGKAPSAPTHSSQPSPYYMSHIYYTLYTYYMSPYICPRIICPLIICPLLPSSLCGTGWWASACFVLAVIRWLTHLGEKRTDRWTDRQTDRGSSPSRCGRTVRHRRVTHMLKSASVSAAKMKGLYFSWESWKTLREGQAGGCSCCWGSPGTGASPEPPSSASSAPRGPRWHRGAHSLFLFLLPRALQVVAGQVEETRSLLILQGRHGCVQRPPRHSEPHSGGA